MQEHKTKRGTKLSPTRQCRAFCVCHEISYFHCLGDEITDWVTLIFSQVTSLTDWVTINFSISLKINCLFHDNLGSVHEVSEFSLATPHY